VQVITKQALSQTILLVERTEGVKDFVGKNGMVVIEVVAGCMFDVYMESFSDV
jgi:hypothetical protein